MFVRYQGNTDDKLIFNNHDLDNVPKYKHLGVIIQSNLSWNSHIDYIQYVRKQVKAWIF